MILLEDEQLLVAFCAFLSVAWSVVPAEFVGAKARPGPTSTISAIVNFTLRVMTLKTSSKAFLTASEPNADWIYGGMNTPSSAYSGITASVFDAFSAALYFPSRVVTASMVAPIGSSLLSPCPNIGLTRASDKSDKLENAFPNSGQCLSFSAWPSRPSEGFGPLAHCSKNETLILDFPD